MISPLQIITYAALSYSLTSTVGAFTNGTLLPAYLCGPANDGNPKTLGGVLKSLVRNVKTVQFNKNSTNDIKLSKAQVEGDTATRIPNTAFMLASFHNSDNSIEAKTNMMFVNSSTVLTPGAPLPLTLLSNQIPGAKEANPLAGCLIYAEDINGTRLGSFTDTDKFLPFPGCGTGPDGKSFGMVQ